jgi:DNA ligase-1
MNNYVICYIVVVVFHFDIVSCSIGHSSSFSNVKVNKSKFITRYDIEVEDNHNYIANNIVVHNCRVLAKKVDEHTIEYTSRKGKVYTTLHHFDTILLSILSIGEIVDGEVYVHGMTFQQIVRLLKKWRPETADLELHLYDKADIHMDYQNRLKWLETNLNAGSPIVLVETNIALTENDVYNYHDTFVQEGYEGVIVRNKRGTYKFRHRSKDLQKYKEFIDEEFIIVGGKAATGAHEGCVVFECEYTMTDGTKDTFDVTPKATLKSRRQMLKDLDKYIGKELTVRYQEKSEDGAPIFPVGVVVRDYE